MAEQLSIFGLWEVVKPEVIEEPPPPPPPPPVPVDPRQVDLLNGAQPLRSTLEDACIGLDADAVRRAHEELLRRFLGQRWADRAPGWAESIDWLVGRAGEELTVDEAVARAQAVLGPEGQARFPEAPGYVLKGVRSSALGRAVERLVAERGAGARLSDGRPAGYLLLLADDAPRARSVLAAACASGGFSDARWLGYLGEAAWRCGEVSAALDAYGVACLEDPTAVDMEMVTCQPVLDLIDLGEDRELEAPVLGYLPVLADLNAVHPLDDRALELPSQPTPARRLAALLRGYRSLRASGALDEPARIGAKREMLRVAPAGLRELLRRI